MIQTDPINSGIFQELYASIGSDPAFLGELLDTYLIDAPRLIGEMSTSFLSGDAATFRRAAHSLKSNSANFGASHLAVLCKELEEMGKSGVLNGAEEKLRAVQAEYAGVETALEAKRAALGRE